MRVCTYVHECVHVRECAHVYLGDDHMMCTRVSARVCLLVRVHAHGCVGGRGGGALPGQWPWRSQTQSQDTRLRNYWLRDLTKSHLPC